MRDFKTNDLTNEKMILKIVENDAEEAVFQKFIYDVYCTKKKWLDEKDYPNKRVTDIYDSNSEKFIIFLGEEVAGCFRLVGESFLGFPHEKEVCRRLPDVNSDVDKLLKEKIYNIGRNGIMEITRMASKAKNRIVTADFAKAVYWYGYHNDIEAYFMVIDMSFFLHCQSLFIPLTPIDIPIFCEGSWTIPCILFRDEMKDSLRQNILDIYNYLIEPSNLQGAWERKKIQA